ncbi:MAG: preprotein translocase subunit SecG [Chitinophagales bacterium]|nr:preprotein translocase subunit SecG [Erysipelotrichaceae bacterium]
MYIVFSIFILILCILLSLVVLVQNPKGGGLTQSLGGVSSQVFGAKNSAGLVEKITWYLAIAIVILSMTSVMFIGDSNATDDVEKSTAETLIEDGDVPFSPTTPVETFPTTTPEGE